MTPFLPDIWSQYFSILLNLSVKVFLVPDVPDGVLLHLHAQQVHLIGMDMLTMDTLGFVRYPYK